MRSLRFSLLFAIVCTYAFISCNTSTEKKTESTQSTQQDLPVSTKNKEADSTFREGLKLFDQGDGTKARTMFAKAIALDSTMSIAHVYYALGALTPQEFNDELAKAKANLGSANDWEKDYYEVAVTYNTNDVDKRIATLEKIAKAYPDAARAHMILGQVYETNNQFDKARQEFQKAIDLNDKWVGGYLNMGYSYLFDTPKDFKKAEEFATKAAAIAPNSPGIHILLGDTYRAQDSLEKAGASYSKAIQLEPNQPEAYYKLGHVYSFTGKMDEARKNYASAGKYDQSIMGATANIANTYLYANDPAGAMKYYNTEISKLDSSSTASSKNNLIKLSNLQSLAMIALHIGDTTTLQKTISQLQPINSQVGAEVGTEEGKTVQEANNIYWLSLLSAARGNFDDAKAKAEQQKQKVDGIKSPRKLEDYEFLMGYIAYKQKDFAGAIKHFEKSDQNDVYKNYWLALANEAAGNTDKAKSMYKQLAIYNFNSTGFALIRSEMKKKAAM